MEGKFNYEKLFRYPHLLGKDKAIWDDFISKFPDLFDTVDYDVHVGSGIDALGETSETMYNQWKELTKKRIDVIGYKDGSPSIVEVKDRVNLGTLGQVLGYQFLYSREHPDLGFVSLIVITADCGPDDLAILKHYNVKCFILSDI
jgi:hypothetical protein